MTNFERMKSLNNEYEMTDLFMYVLSTNFSEMIKKDGTITGLPLLYWLQKEYKKPEPKLCCIKGCNKIHFGNGFCSTHYMRLKRTGNPMNIKKKGRKPTSK